MIQKLDIKQFIPTHIKSGIKGNLYKPIIESKETNYIISYWRNVFNQTGMVGRRKYVSSLPRNIKLNKETLEVIGLLQGEMSKTHRGPVTFCNSEPRLIKKVLDWFADYLDLSQDKWHWYIKINLPVQANEELNKLLEEELVDFWMLNCPLKYDMKYPKTLSFVRKSKNLIPKNEGTLIIERRNPIFVQTLQKLVNDITLSMLERSEEEINWFMRGIIAAES